MEGIFFLLYVFSWIAIFIATSFKKIDGWRAVVFMAGATLAMAVFYTPNEKVNLALLHFLVPKIVYFIIGAYFVISSIIDPKKEKHWKLVFLFSGIIMTMPVFISAINIGIIWALCR